MTESPIPPGTPAGRIHWYHKAKGGRGPESSTGAVVSHHLGVKFTLAQQAYSMGASAMIALAQHRKTGAAKIEVEKHNLDWYVMLTDADPGGSVKGVWRNQMDRSAMSIEFGWTQTHVFGKKLKQPIHHDGLHILGGVMDRAARRYGGG
jgi:hypothetical protein